MSPHSPRTLASAVLLVGLLAGCIGRPRPDDKPIPDPPKNRPGTLTQDQIERDGNSSSPVAKSLASRFPGVIVSETASGGVSIRIRGVSSFYASNEPLYVVDGSPITPGPGGTLALNAHDIESIQVLKDPAETGIYGMRGANGVIVIKTKGSR